jgi:hypothetical protein
MESCVGEASKTTCCAAILGNFVTFAFISSIRSPFYLFISSSCVLCPNCVPSKPKEEKHAQHVCHASVTFAKVLVQPLAHKPAQLVAMPS